MKTVSEATLKARLTACLQSSEQGPVVVRRNGKPAIVLLAIADEDELERLVLAYSPKFQRIMETSRRQIAETGGIPHEEFWRQVEAETKTRAKRKRTSERGKRTKARL